MSTHSTGSQGSPPGPEHDRRPGGWVFPAGTRVGHLRRQQTGMVVDRVGENAIVRWDDADDRLPERVPVVDLYTLTG